MCLPVLKFWTQEGVHRPEHPIELPNTHTHTHTHSNWILTSGYSLPRYLHLSISIFYLHFDCAASVTLQTGEQGCSVQMTDYWFLCQGGDTHPIFFWNILECFWTGLPGGDGEAQRAASLKRTCCVYCEQVPPAGLWVLLRKVYSCKEASRLLLQCSKSLEM